ncbi:hypothetical protein CYMTET_31026 [Cymbomonas tetramitiformis]|uniref:PiggyBac transposable element-derived protein domain-containing protein n=1 Tax=Cymbomonas tetramitiformis TaxID=36881 RepID=A0AAE0KTL5_9CHLO|nr:hypothetical protein CYMTET_31026 [Cymbomonas tetramitiformis]
MVEKIREVWDTKAKEKAELAYTRLNVIDDYNNNMNGLDIADQLREIYRFDGPWMRQRKWWWALFLWALGVAVVNACLLYKRQCEQQEVPEGKRLTHVQFNVILAQELCSGQRAAKWKHLQDMLDKKRVAGVPVSVPPAKRVRGATLTPKGVQASLLQRTTGRHPTKDTHQHASDCQWCKFRSRNTYLCEPVRPFATVKTPKARLPFGCLTCETWFFSVSCWNEFHHL